MISRRLSAVEELVNDAVLRGELRERLKEIGDMRRLVGRCVYGTANGRDVKALGGDYAVLPEISELLKDAKSSY